MNITGIRSTVTGILCIILCRAALTEPIAVRQAQGATRGFLLIRSAEGKIIADGDVSQVPHGDRITTHVLYRFRDGSLDDDVSVYTQHGTFQLVSDHHIQRGPYFPKPIDVLVDVPRGNITSRSVDKDGKEKVETEHKDLPPDISNGIVGTLLLNVAHNTDPFKLSFLAPTGKGRVIKLAIAPESTASFVDAGRARKATVFRIKIDLGGVAGAIAPVIGKQPADMLVWIAEGEVPALIREIGALYDDGPTVSIELSGTTFHPTTVQKP